MTAKIEVFPVPGMLDIGHPGKSGTESQERGLRRIPAIRAPFRCDDPLFDRKVLEELHREGIVSPFTPVVHQRVLRSTTDPASSKLRTVSTFAPPICATRLSASR